MFDNQLHNLGFYSPSGNEEILKEEIKKEIMPFSDKVYVDNSGNLIAQKLGEGPKIAIAAMMDEPSFIAVSAHESGFIRLSAMGQINPLFCVGQKISFLNGISGVLISEPEEGKCADMSNLYADIGAKSKEEAMNILPSGTCAVYSNDFFNTGANMTGRGLSTRVLCQVLLSTLIELKDFKNEIYFVFVSKGRLPDSGIKSAIYGIDPEYFIALSAIPSNDTPKGREPKAPLGSGVYAKVQENSFFYSSMMTDKILKSAKSCGVLCGPYVSKSGDNSQGKAQLVRNGILCGSIAIGARYLNTPIETICQDDANDVQKLLTEILKNGI